MNLFLRHRNILLIFDKYAVFFPHNKNNTLLHPRHAKIGRMTYAASEAQAQPAHLRRLVTGFANRNKMHIIIFPKTRFIRYP